MTPFFDIWDNATQNKHVKKVIGTNITARTCSPPYRRRLRLPPSVAASHAANIVYSALAIAYFFTQILVLISYVLLGNWS